MSVFRMRGVTFSYANATRPALADVEYEVARGGIHAVVGPNGCGKSTLLRVLLGAVHAQIGSVEFLGRPVAHWPRRQLARTIGVVAQSEEVAFPLAVRELVEMGRYPHLGALGGAGAADRAAVDGALTRCEIDAIADRSIATLSGGERQRARIARALAQQPNTFLLDEPTASLDVHHEMEIFELLRTLAADGATVVLVTHNLNLAARYADRMLLLDGGSVAAHGSPADVLREELLARVFRWPVAVLPHAGAGRDRGAPQVVPLSRQ